eukprot:6447488-Pyramimonas_sp.AAC.1
MKIWRYTGGDRVEGPLVYQPRQRALMRMTEGTYMAPKVDDLDANPVFPEVPFEFVIKLTWTTANFQPDPEAIQISEMR